MWYTILLSFFFSIHFITAFLLFLYAVNVLFMVVNSRKYQKLVVEPPLQNELPTVTIQLPIFNEAYVASRIIYATAQIEYPKHLLEIQVLDDSTDNTLDLSRSAVKELQKEGIDITLIHRTKREGQKGGALREALEVAKGEFIAIFDADFVPNPHFLKKVMPHFSQENIGMVQTRWGHLNANYSPLTQAQAVAIDTHFMIEQVTRSGREFFFNFNGTGGVWRKETIYDAGNWQDDTITEDLDLSYRAQMKGWKFHYCHDIVNPAELPVQLAAYKSQQHRWAMGSIQTALKLLGKVLKTDASLFKKLQACLHLSYYSVHPLLLLNALAFLPALVALKYFFGVNTFSIMGFVFTLLLLAIAPLSTLYSQYLIYPDWKKRMKWLPFLILVGTGLAVSNTKAVLQALLGKKIEFVRTPKHGITKSREAWKGKKYQMPITIDAFIEGLVVLYLSGAVVFAVTIEMFYIVPFILYYLFSFLYIFLLGLVQNSELRALLSIPFFGSFRTGGVIDE